MSLIDWLLLSKQNIKKCTDQELFPQSQSATEDVDIAAIPQQPTSQAHWLIPPTIQQCVLPPIEAQCTGLDLRVSEEFVDVILHTPSYC